ncbi:serine hydrolase domain-containing protein [Flagellimonas sp. S174]|uniref:serine hydrolase domain-containing protein n=1 Tax=Flagellimonas sp. S174 TaxID=3410790 RepID=UPI003BF4BB75
MKSKEKKVSEKNFIPRVLSLLVFVLSFISGYCQSGNIELSGDSQIGVSTERFKRYDRFLKDEISNGRIPGAVSFVMRKDEIIHNEAFGFSDISNKSPMDIDNIFFIQSMTKPIISAGIMMLYEEGHFLLTDPVSKYLEGFKALRVIKDMEEGIDGESEPWEGEITIAQLLTHTAGFSHGLGASKYDQQLRAELFEKEYANIEEKVSHFLTIPLANEPATQWRYSAATDVLSVLIEKFSGMSTERFLTERIFVPLGMDDTGYNLPKSKFKRIVQLHTYNQENKLTKSDFQPSPNDNKVFTGVNGLFSTTSDYMKFCQMLFNGGEFQGKRLLSGKTVELMAMNHLRNMEIAPGRGFGLGFGVVEDVTQSGIVGLKGQFYWGGAFCTYFLIDPEEELISILMTQVWPYSEYYANKMRQFVYQAIDD